MRGTDNPRRFWFSLWGLPRFANGWCFGDTPEDARQDALAQVKQYHQSTRGNGTLTLQRDTTPADYFDFKVEV